MTKVKLRACFKCQSSEMGCPVRAWRCILFSVPWFFFFFFSNLSSMFNIWGSNMEIQILAILGLHILLWKMHISLCLTYKVFLVYRALFFCLVPVGVFICSSSFGELNIYNYLTSLEILLRGFLDNFKFKRLFMISFYYGTLHSILRFTEKSIFI